MNCLFQIMSAAKRGTWRSPGGKSNNEMGYIITKSRLDFRKYSFSPERTINVRNKSSTDCVHIHRP